MYRTLYRFLTSSARLAVRTGRSKDLEIMVLRHQLGVLHRQNTRPDLNSFDEIFRTEDLKILKTPVRTPVANTFAERWIGTLRRELLDRTIIWNQHQLEQLIIDYINHYTSVCRPGRRDYRALQLSRYRVVLLAGSA